MEISFESEIEAEIYDHNTNSEDITSAKLAVDEKHIAITVNGVETVFNLQTWLKVVTCKLFDVDLGELVDMDAPTAREQIKEILTTKRVLRTV